MTVPAPPLSRRLLLGGALVSAALAVAKADGRTHPVAKLPVLPLDVGIAEQNGRAVVNEAWVARQLARAQELMAPHGIQLALVNTRSLEEKFAQLETAEDRDALATMYSRQVINVFVVRSLRDVDNPRIQRMGVRWRLRRDVSKDYVIVAASALPSTLCHELGHFLGNGHSQVVNNVMSYRRDDPKAVRFDSHQGARMRAVAGRLLARGKLVAVKQETKG